MRLGISIAATLLILQCFYLFPSVTDALSLHGVGDATTIDLSPTAASSSHVIHEPGQALIQDVNGDNGVDATDNDEPFCRVGNQGWGYVMESWFMTSFTTKKINGERVSWCVLLWFEGWTLDTEAKYIFACFGVFFMGVANEAFVWLRKYHAQRNRYTRMDEVIRAALYGCQMTIAYLMMLVVMLYEIILFFSVILGLAVGHFYLNPPVVMTQDEEEDVFEKRSSDSSYEAPRSIDQEEKGESCCKNESSSEIRRLKLLPPKKKKKNHMSGGTPCCGGSNF